MAVDPAWIALAGTLCGGIGLKLAEHYLGRSKVKIDNAAQLRSELRLEITAQREEVRQLEAEVDKWREEYYNLRDKYMTLQTELSQAVFKIKADAVHATEISREISSMPPITPVDKAMPDEVG